MDIKKAVAVTTQKMKRAQILNANSQDSIASDDSSKIGDEPTPPHLVQPNTEKMRAQKRALKRKIRAQDERELRTYPPVVPFDSDISYAFDRLQMLGHHERYLPPSKLHKYVYNYSKTPQ